ncbi:MAG: FABP family protein [Deltaproteobacteria bacterium]|nr:MAG: FABP family protein [Deltaproteobacteria bacterium]
MGDELEGLGPLAQMVGIWVGDSGEDVAPSPEREVGETGYRERIVVTSIGRVDNHEQVLHGVRYAKTAWRMPLDEEFHEETGYWLWDASREQVMQCFVVPRGISVLAGGAATPNATKFEILAELGSPTFGIASNPFLDREFKTVRYEYEVEFEEDGVMRYRSNVFIQVNGQDDVFRHSDVNTLRRVHVPD